MHVPVAVAVVVRLVALAVALAIDVQVHARRGCKGKAGVEEAGKGGV